MGVRFNQLPVAAVSTIASDDYIAMLDTSENLMKRMLVEHSSDTPVFGVGTPDAYGHNKTINDLNSTEYVFGETLAARLGNALATMVGQIEPRQTAAYNYAKGDYFIWVDKFVIATKAITAGQTLAIGTNVEVTTLSSILSSIQTDLAVLDQISQFASLEV